MAGSWKTGKSFTYPGSRYGVSTALAVRRQGGPAIPWPRSGLKRLMSRTAAVLFLFACCVGPQVVTANTVSLPAPTGTYGVGRRLIHWIDARRAETMSARPNDRREIVVWLWYPAPPGLRLTPAPYVDRLDRLATGISGDEVSLARSAQSHAIGNAPLAAQPAQFPVIFFSPGSGSIPALYSSLCEDLASHGYVVAGMDHPYDDAAVVLADGRVVRQAKRPNGGEELLRFERARVTVRAQDLRFALDQFTRIQAGQIQDPLQGRLDLSRIGAFGHSVGGMTAAEFCKQDRRVLACANMDGVVAARPAYPDAAGRGPRQPFLFLEKPLPAMKGEKPEAARRRLTALRERGNVLLAGVRSGRSYRVTITGATHATFSDEEILTGENAKRQRELIGIVRKYLRAFFDRSVRNQQTTLLDTSPSDDAVQVEAFSPK